MSLPSRTLRLLVAGGISSFAMTALADNAVFYLGTYSKNPGEGIFQGTLDQETGALGPLNLAYEVMNPGFVAVAPDRRHLFAVLESKDEVAAFDAVGDGSIALLNKLKAGGGAPCHLAVDHTGRYVLVANYSGGNLACFRVKSDGSLGDQTALIPFSGSGPDPVRQKKSYAHMVAVDPSNRFAYVCDLGADKVWSFRFDAEHGTFAPLDPPAGIVPPGAGPRHLAFSPDGRFVYVNNEMGLSVTVFGRDLEKGTLTALQTIPLDAANPGSRHGVTTAEIVCHPSGKWLYVSSRGDDVIAVFQIGADGLLTHLENAPATVQTPRGMDIDPSGKWLVVGGQKDNVVAVLRIDPKTGKLSPQVSSAEVGAPVSVVFVPPAPKKSVK